MVYAQRGIDFIARDEWGYNDALKYQIFNSKPRAEFQRIIIKAAANDNYPFEGTPNSNFAGERRAHIRDDMYTPFHKSRYAHRREPGRPPCYMQTDNTGAFMM